jgi:acyl-CoA thioester hydrolase
MRITLPFRPATYDIDVAGIMSNIVYIRWLEDLRLAFFDQVLPFDQAMVQGLVPTLVRTEIDYLRSLRLFDPVVGSMELESLGRTSARLRAEFRVNDELVARAVQVGVFVDTTTGKAAPIPQRVRAALGNTTEPA